MEIRNLEVCSTFFICLIYINYLAVPRPALGHWPGDNFTHTILIIARYLIWSLALAERVLQNKFCLSLHQSFHPSFRLSFCSSFCHPSILLFCPFFCLRRSFLRILSLVFSKFWLGARNEYKVVLNRVGFSGKKFTSKIGKMDQKWARNRVFKIFWNI